MNKVILLTIPVIILAGITVFIFMKDTEDISGPPLITPTPTSTLSKTTVTYSDSGYSSSPVTIKKGGVVTFENKSSKMMWTASAMHPTHKVYPGSDIIKCGTSLQVGIFDACKGYGVGESWEFKFNEQGTWKYHNHLQPSHTGTVIVE